MLKCRWSKILTATALLLGAVAAEAKVEVAPVFSDNAVLQRRMAVPVWGKADPGEKVTVKFADQTRETTAGNDGKWFITLDPMEASKENRVLTVSGPANSVAVNNILVGEVWLASGQSNMQQPLWTGGRFCHRNANATGKEVADKTDIPTLRFVRMPHRWSETPSDNEKVVWHVAKPGAALERASAVAFFFGRELALQLDVPVGILGAYWSGTRIEPWITPEGFNSVPQVADIARRVNSKIGGTKENKEISEKVISEYSAWLERYKQALAKGELPPVPPEFPSEQLPYRDHQQPTVLYNKMLRPFVPYAMRGGIWYQGESNRGEGMLYRYKMQALLNGWKDAFRNPAFKLYFVQLAPYNYGNNPSALAEIQEAQQVFADNEKDAGMAVINDVGDVRDIHPGDKETVGKRLAYLALNRDYGKTDIKADSPKLKSHRKEGKAFILDFDHLESWKVIGGNDIPNFEVAGAEQEFFPAKVEIKGTQLVVSSDKVEKPEHLRYLWNHVNEGKLANEAGLMLGAFRFGEAPTREKLFDALKTNHKLVYEYNLKSGYGSVDKTRVNYVIDNSDGITGNISRVTYFVVLEKLDGSIQFVSAAMDPFTQNAKQLGVPVKSTGATFQQRVKNLHVLSNVDGVSNGNFTEGNIEFWPNNYGKRNAANVPGADGGKYDFGDEKSAPEIGYGCMQIHNFQQKQTVFAYNCFGANANADIGIGNNADGNPDWTFSNSGKNLKKATLYVFVKE